MENLPTTTPAEALQIAPEQLEVANCFLQLGTTHKVAENLSMSPEQVQQILQQPQVRRYVDHVFMELGFNNRVQMRRAMDAVIRQKMQELEESSAGSQKDIADLLALSHKMTMEQLHMQMEVLKLEQKQQEQHIKSQVNVQINNGLDTGTKYSQLIQKLLEDPNA
jgi:hypothetical protein